MIENNFNNIINNSDNIINTIFEYRNKRKLIRIKIAKHIIKIFLYLLKFLYNNLIYKFL